MMAKRAPSVSPGDLLVYEDWVPERGKALLVLTLTQQMITCLRSDGITVVEKPRTLSAATHTITGAKIR